MLLFWFFFSFQFWKSWNFFNNFLVYINIVETFSTNFSFYYLFPLPRDFLCFRLPIHSQERRTLATFALQFSSIDSHWLVFFVREKVVENSHLRNPFSSLPVTGHFESPKPFPFISIKEFYFSKNFLNEFEEWGYSSVWEIGRVNVIVQKLKKSMNHLILVRFIFPSSCHSLISACVFLSIVFHIWWSISSRK